MTQLCLTGPQFSASADPLLDWARFSEDAGFNGIFVFDHLVPLGDPRRPVLELTGALGAVAAITTSITVGTLVMRAPMRGPGISAGVAASLGAVAPGRAVIGLGAGDRLSRQEAGRFGQEPGPLTARLGQVRETALAIRAANVGASVWIGGIHPSVRRLANEVADGWNAWSVTVDEFSELAADLSSGVERTWGGAIIVGTDAGDVESAVRRRGTADGAIVGTVPEVAAELRRFVSAGASRLVLSVLPNRPDRWEVASGLLAELR